MRNGLQIRWQAFLARRHPPSSATLTLVHKRIYIVPSKHGLGFAVLFVLVLIGAINYQLSLGFFFAFLLAGIAHAAMLRTYVVLLGLEIRAGHAQSAFTGESAHFPLILADRRGRTRNGILVLPPNSQPVSADVLPRSETPIKIATPALQRGYLRLPRCRMECRAPTGWFVAWTYIEPVSECLIYPAPEHNPPPLPFGAQSGAAGLRAGTGDDDFAGLREYQPGDAPRRVAWKQVARSDQLYSKRFQSPQSSEVVLDWHTLTGLNTEARLSRLTAWILQAEAGGHHYALILPDLIQPPGCGPLQLEQCLRVLALYPADGNAA